MDRLFYTTIIIVLYYYSPRSFIHSNSRFEMRYAFNARPGELVPSLAAGVAMPTRCLAGVTGLRT